MTSDRRLQVGGWAALLLAALALLRVIVLFAVAHEPDPFAAPVIRVIELGQVGTILAATLGLDPLFRRLAPAAANVIRSAGVTGAILGLTPILATAAGTSGAVSSVLMGFLSSGLIALWFIGGGAILMRGGRDLVRVAWTAELGGAGLFVSAVAIAVRFGGPVGTGQSWIDWFLLLGLFVIIYLVRVWNYVVRGKLPGPGIL